MNKTRRGPLVQAPGNNRNQQVPSQKMAAPLAFCTECWNRLKDGAVFCDQCGKNSAKAKENRTGPKSFR